MDILHDGPNAVLLQINEKYGIPEYTRKAEVISTKEAADKLPNEMFADPVDRKYPINSRADTWVSAAYFAKTAESEGYDSRYRNFVETRIKEAAGYYGIGEDVNTMMDKICEPEVVKQAEDDDLNYGYPETKMYPMFDEYGVKLAGEYFDENRDNYPYDMRRTIARNIMRKAAEYGTDIPDTVRREAGIGMPRVDFMSVQLVDRAHRAPNEKLAEVMYSLNAGLMAATITDIMSVLEKTAETVSEFDRVAGLDMQYGKTVLAPADFLFNVSDKEAEDYSKDAVKLGKYMFSIKKLASLPEHVYTDALGEEFTNRIKSANGYDLSKLSDELNSLPIPDKNALVDSIASA